LEQARGGCVRWRTPVKISASKTLFEVGADSFSPQGVRSVGPRFFESLILQLFQPSWSCVLGHPFYPQGGPAGKEIEIKLASYFQLCRKHAQRARTSGWVRFYKPARLGSLRKTAHSRESVPQKTPFVRLFRQRLESRDHIEPLFIDQSCRTG
jgi:hypothetical protein